ncbi:MAG TPA: 4-(cytidine 5'-diphospho)-2-C-methyl-D-erythritol kinase [Actinomycetota bacterium]|nr:4-(cytidine 5'-diphospho)-2-C-methyl-D-erythritol kinase [Actinomycetota bacterium]
MDAAAKLRVRTGAKLNLFLRVLGLRPDGYHELESIFHSVEFADVLEVAPADEISVTMRAGEGFEGDLPPQEENLIYKAALALGERAGTSAGAAIEVTKRIPIGGGLGGGSSNAAGAIIALNELWDVRLERADMIELARSLGSDVLYCIEGGATSLVTGRGDKLAPLPSVTPLWFVLGISTKPLLTAEVYAHFDTLEASEHPGPAPMTMALGEGDKAGVAALLYNDLQTAAFDLRPELSGKLDALVAAGAIGAGMTGSGPTLFGIASDEGSARRIAQSAAGDFDRVVVTSSAPACVAGPDPSGLL